MGSKPDEVVVIGTETVVEFIAIVSKIVEKHKTFDKLGFALTLITKYILSVRKVELLRKLFFSYRNIVLGYFFCMSVFCIFLTWRGCMRIFVSSPAPGLFLFWIQFGEL